MIRVVVMKEELIHRKYFKCSSEVEEASRVDFNSFPTVEVLMFVLNLDEKGQKSIYLMLKIINVHDFKEIGNRI
jgi:hypothetical protein